MEVADGDTIGRRKKVAATLLLGLAWALPLGNVLIGMGAILIAIPSIFRARSMLMQIGKLFGLLLLFIPLCYLGFMPTFIHNLKYVNASPPGMADMNYLLAAVGGITYSWLVIRAGLLPFDFE